MEELVASKPSGVDYQAMQVSDVVFSDLDGNVVEGDLRPSSDLKAHLVPYKYFSTIGEVVHIHSIYTTVWVQAGRSIPALGTIHSDYFHGPVPVTEPLRDEEIEGDYVLNTGLAICRRLAGGDPLATPAVQMAGHAPFCWEATAADVAIMRSCLGRWRAWLATLHHSTRRLQAFRRLFLIGTTFVSMARRQLMVKNESRGSGRMNSGITSGCMYVY